MRVLLRDLTPGQDYLMQFRSNDGNNVSEWSQVYAFRTDGDAVAPADVANLEWKPTGESFIATWDAPTKDANGQTLKDFSHYEVTVKAGNKTKVYTTTATTWEFTLIMNNVAFGGIELTVEITVKAVDNTKNKSTGVVKTATEDTPPVPSTPIVTNTMGQITVEWDGGTSAGQINPFNLEYVAIHASTTDNFAPSTATLVGRFEGWIGGKQKTIVTGLTYGQKNYFKLVSVNKKGKESTPSGQAFGTPERITGLDIKNGSITIDQINFVDQLGGDVAAHRSWYQTTEPTVAEGAKDNDIWFDTDDGYHMRVRVNGTWMEARDATIAAAAGQATTALSTANGKNTVFYGTAAPSNTTNPGTRAGDIWFVRNATTGVVSGQYEWSGTAWNARTLDNAVIANLDAGKITAGTLDANRIAANTITADKLTVAAKADDLLSNGRFTDLNASGLPVDWVMDSPTATYATSTAAADIGSGTRALRINSAANNSARAWSATIPAAGGEKFGIQAWVKGAAAYAGNAFALEVFSYDGVGILPLQTAYTGALTTTPTLYSGSVTLPPGTKQISVNISLLSNAAARTIWVSDVQLRRQVSSVFIADGAVSATKINAGAVTADAIGTNLIITAKANIGNAVIDDANIANIKSGKIVAEETATNLIIANTANIKDAVITSAKIVTLTADKITTGSLAVDQKIIAGPVAADHAEMSDKGFRVYTNDLVDGLPREVIRMGTDTNDFFGVVDSQGNLVASVDDTGRGSFTEINTPKLYVAGKEIAQVVNDGPRGETAHFLGTPGFDIAPVFNPVGVAEVGQAVYRGRSYLIRWRMTVFVNAGVQFQANMRWTQGAEGDTITQAPAPRIDSTSMAQWKFFPGGDNKRQTIEGECLFVPTFTSRVRFGLTGQVGPDGNIGNVAIANDRVEINVTDVGPHRGNVGFFSNMGGSLNNGVVAPPPPASVTQQYFVDLAPSGRASWQGNGQLMNWVGGDVYQGYNGTNGNTRGQFWFDLPNITGNVDRADLWVYFRHWYFNSGGTMRLGITDQRGAFTDHSFRGLWETGGWPKPGGREVMLPSDWWPLFRGTDNNSFNGRGTALTLGPGVGNNQIYYGVATDARLRIYYTQ